MSDDRQSLDPPEWAPLRAVGHEMVEALLRWLEEVRDQPAWTPMPEEVKARFRAPLPMEGEGPEAVWGEFQRSVLPYRLGNVHPRFWARVMGSGTGSGALGQLAAAVLNDNLSGLESSAVHVEAQVLRWMKELMGFPEGASGLLTSGCSMANLVALQVARDSAASLEVSVEGVQALPRRLVAYASDEVHSSVGRALVVLGLGSASLRRIPVDAAFGVDVEAMARAIAADQTAGLQPFCIVGSAGTVNTGAIDPLEALADLGSEQRLTFHVDAAFGAWVRLSPRLRGLVRGLERADSVALDLHKWGAAPYGVGCVLVRDAQAHHRAFQTSAAYLEPYPRGVAAADFPGNELGPELSRGSRGLGPWMAFREHGLRRLGESIERNVAQAAFVAACVQDEPELELMAPVPLNLVTFRYRGRGVPEARLDALNAELVIRIQESGLAVPSTTRLCGRTVIRLAIVNHRSRREDFQRLLEAVLRTGRELATRGSR